MDADRSRSAFGTSMKRWAVRQISDARNRCGERPLAPHERDDVPLSDVLDELVGLRQAALRRGSGQASGTGHQDPRMQRNGR